MQKIYHDRCWKRGCKNRAHTEIGLCSDCYEYLREEEDLRKEDTG